MYVNYTREKELPKFVINGGIQSGDQATANSFLRVKFADRKNEVNHGQLFLGASVDQFLEDACQAL